MFLYNFYKKALLLPCLDPDLVLASILSPYSMSNKLPILETMLPRVLHRVSTVALCQDSVLPGLDFSLEKSLLLPEATEIR